jgi:hypothetical protein
MSFRGYASLINGSIRSQSLSGITQMVSSGFDFFVLFLAIGAPPGIRPYAISTVPRENLSDF